MSYTNPLKRFLWRRDVFKRIKERFCRYKRSVTKSELVDLAALFQGREPKVIFDVGANVGFLTWQFTKTFGNAVIHAFEPDPAPRRTLESTHRGNSRIQIFPIAAAESDGELAFVQRRVSCNSSLLELAAKAGGNGETTIRVQACTLDRFCAEHSVAHIDLLKIDTEGADLRVLQGARNLLEKGAIDVVMTEVFFVATYKQQATFDEIAGFLKAYGFGIFNVYIGRETACGQACYGNAIFISQHLQQTLAISK
jgi:FkbM family methyltransferase